MYLYIIHICIYRCMNMSIHTYIYTRIYIYIYVCVCVCVCACVYGGSRKVGMCPQKQIDPKPQVPTLILEATVGTWSETRQRESWNLYCREKGTAITRLLGSLQYCRKRQTTTAATALVLQTARNCNYYNCSSIAEKETVIITTFAVLQKERN